ncbi:MAG TPA: aldehyde dehydrogenase [Tenuifilaceae bacterium]|nr:aldehyde dehydrogenase [Tenuifilaceae bacterium]HPJ45188.1 aldehyde dehydrogenase [Tenuifilaceae bacterium]
MENTSKKYIEEAIRNQRDFFNSGKTTDINFRIGNLKNFYAAIKKYEGKIGEALWTDLRKSKEEAYLTETSIVLQETKNHIKNLKRWARPKRVRTPIHLLPSSSWTIYEPLGVALIMAPWNYPFQLLMNALVGSISAGCCTILKPSPYTPTIAKVMEDLVKETFDPNFIDIVQGNRTVNEILLEQRFDTIFYTGSPAVGKVVMKAAAENLTPVILELGGKSPCVVDKNANINVAARRIAWGKTINAGQTCIAPDYLLVHSSVKEELIKKIGESINTMFGEDIESSKFFPRIVNQQAFDRLEKLVQHGRIRFGGQMNRDKKFFAPTIIDKIEHDFPIMQEEIFGPILPVIEFEHIDQAVHYINSNDKPLAFYYFGKNKDAKEILRRTTSGGGCINDTLMHITNHRLPFGGVGNSGIGKYHGEQSFHAFSNSRAIVSTPTWIDLPLKYAPFKYFEVIKKII